MKRDAFEEMVQGALVALAADVVEQPISKASVKRNRIGGIRFGEAEKTIGQTVSRMTQTGRNFKPIATPLPEIVPPCF